MKELTNLKTSSSILIKRLKFSQIIKPEQLFSPLSKTPWAMWLDSSNSSHVDCQYDIFVWQPKITLETNGNNTQVNWPAAPTKNYSSEEEPLALLSKVQTSIFKSITLPQSKLPFIGGAIGYFSYDLGHRFETLPFEAEQDIKTPEMAVGIYTHAVIYERKTQDYFLVCLASEQSQLTEFIDNLLAPCLKKNSVPFKLKADWQSNMDKSAYAKKFNQVQQYLLSGDCYQINLAQRFSAKYQGDEFDAYQALRTSNQAPFSAFLRFEHSTILSISPERFLKVDDGKVQSKPIKGTRPRANSAELDAKNANELQHAEKDRAENLMIVDLLRNDISKVCQPGTVKVPKLFAIESFPAVHHLVSTVEGELEAQFNACDLLRGAFPGGSITGAPKIRAMEIIDELEPHQRSIYCGSIGYISACGNMDTSITIRTLICHDNTIYCWAGGGLVADSDVNSEYQETYDKVAKILPILTNLNLP